MTYFRLMLIAVTALVGASLSAQGPVGSEFKVNTTVTNSQRVPDSGGAVACDDTGNFVVVWTSTGQDSGTTDGVYGQRYSSTGTAMGAEFLVNVTVSNHQRNPAVAMDADGDFVVAWQSFSASTGFDIYARRYNSSGVAQGGEFQVNTSVNFAQTLPAVAMDPSGNFVICWDSASDTDDDTDGTGVYARRYDSSGTALGGEFRVNTVIANDQARPAVAMDSSGNFVVVWASFGQDFGGTWGIFGQRYTNTGATAGSEFSVNLNSGNDQDNPAIAMEDNGDFVVVYSSMLWDGSGNSVAVQRFSAAGAKDGAEFIANSTFAGNQELPSVAMDADGEFVVTWSSDGDQDGNGKGVYAQRYTKAGVMSGVETLVNTFTNSDQTSPSVAMYANGDYVVVWNSFGQDTDLNGVYGQLFNGQSTIPVIDLMTSSATYTEDDPPVLLAPSATLTAFVPNLNGGALVVNGLNMAQDSFVVKTTANVRRNGTDIEYDASGLFAGGEVVIGTCPTSGAGSGQAAAELIIGFNVSCTPAIAEAVIRSVAYVNTTQNPSQALRNFTFTISDGAGGNSAPVNMNGNVISVADAPTLTSFTLLFDNEDNPKTITFNDLEAAGDEADVDSSPVYFRFAALGTGTLLHNGLPAVVGADVLPGHTLLWTPPADAIGTHTVAEFVALDAAVGTLTSGTSVPLQVSLAQVNDEPSFQDGGNPAQSIFGTGAQTVGGWATLISAGPANESGQLLTFNVTVTGGTLTFSAGPAVDTVTGNLTYTASSSGTANVTIELQDDGGVANGGDDTSAPVNIVIDVAAGAGSIYVDPTFAGLNYGDDPPGPATFFGIDAFATPQDAIAAANPGATIILAADTYPGFAVTKSVTLQGTAPGTTIRSGSPALTVNSPGVVSNGIDYEVDTVPVNDPTILILSGDLTISNGTVSESNAFNQAAIRLTGGTIIFGVNVTLDRQGSGQLIDNQTAGAIDATGVTLLNGGAAFADNFAIEDAVTHALDNGANGLVTWVAGNLYVTTASGSIQRGVDAATAGNTINIDDGTYVGATAVNKSVTIAGPNAGIHGTSGSRVTEARVSSSVAGTVLFTISAASVTIDGLEFYAFNTLVSRCVTTSGTTFSGLDIRNCLFRRDSTGPATGFGTVYAIEVLGDGTQTVTIHRNRIAGTVNGSPPPAFRAVFAKGLLLNDVSATVGGAAASDGNTIRGFEEDVLVQDGGNTTIQNNTFVGTGVDIVNPAAGVSINIFQNSFSPSDHLVPQSLLVRFNDTATTLAVTGNVFTNHTVGAVIAAARNVTLDGNTFSNSASATNYTHVLFSTSWPTASPPPAAVTGASLDLRNNQFNHVAGPASGRALDFQNGNSASTVGTIIVGPAGNANTFDGNLPQYIRLQTATLVGPLFTPATNPAPANFSTNMDATNNTFGGLLPTAMTIAQLATLESKLQHKVDNPALGLITLGINNSPQLINGPYTFTAINEDNFTSSGDPVDLSSDIFDVDGPDTGMAVISVDDTNGTWEYSTNNGGAWTAFGAVSNTSAVLLTSDTGNNRIRFVPDADFFGTASITLRGWDQVAGSGNNGDTGVDVSVNGTGTGFSANTETATITVNPVNDAPTFTASNPAAANEDSGLQTVSSWAGGFVAGPANESGQAVAAYIVSNVSNPGLFSVAPAVDASGNLTYTPAANAFGTSTFDVQVQDDGGTANSGVDLSTVQQFTITINPVNDAPTFTASNPPAVNEDSGLQTVSSWAGGFVAGPGNESGQAVAAYIVSNISNPGLFAVAPAVDASGNLTYTPAADAFGTSTFDVQVQDDGGTPGVDTSVAQQFTITINPVNDAPTFTASNPPAVNEDSGLQTVSSWAGGFVAGPANESGQAVQAYIVSNISNPGLFSVAPAVDVSGNLTYTPAANAFGTSTFDVQVQDDGGTPGVDTSAPQQFTITIDPVNDAPTLSAGTLATSTNEDTAITISFADLVTTTSATDSDGSVVSFNVTAVNSGTLEIDVGTTSVFVAYSGQPVTSADLLRWTPAGNANGAPLVAFTVQAVDNGTPGTATSVTAEQVRVNVTPVNDAPVAHVSSGIGLNPTSFATLGTLNPGANVLVDTTAVTMSGGANFTGVVSGGIAVFCFSDVNIAAGITLTVIGTRPFALLSHGDFTLSGTINADASGVTAGPGGHNAGLSLPSNGAGPGGGTGSGNGAGGGAFGGSGGQSTGAASGGSAYGDLLATLEGGSGGGSTSYNGGQFGGGGGGAVELGAAGVLTVSGSAQVNCNGASGSSGGLADGGGGGAGGGIRLHAPSGTMAGTLNAQGGNGGAATGGGSYDGGGGGGGRIVTVGLTVTGTTLVNGGVGPGSATSGTAGSVISIPAFVLTLNEDTTAGLSLGFTDVDLAAGTNIAQVSLSATNGTLTLATTTGLTFTTGTGTADYSMVFTGLAADITSALATVTYDPDPDFFGADSIVFVVNDQGNFPAPTLSDTATIPVTVNPVNDAPSFTASNPAAVDEDAGTQTINGWASGFNPGNAFESGQTVAAYIVTNLSNPGLFSVAPAVDTSGNLTYTPAADAFGVCTFDVQVQDDGGTANGGVDTSSVQTFTITVNAVNDAPTFTGGANPIPMLVNPGAQTFAGWATGMSVGPANESAQSLTGFTVTQTGGPLGAFTVAPSVTLGGTLSYTPDTAATGTFTFDVTLADDGSGIAPNVNTSAAHVLTIILVPVPTQVYVDSTLYAGYAQGDPVPGPATYFGIDAFTVVQPAVNIVASAGTVFVASGTYLGATVSKTITLDLQAGPTLTGASPVISHSSGTLTIVGGELDQNTAFPTIALSGGTLILDGVTVLESSVGNHAAIEVTAGTLDISSLGGNTIRVRGLGGLLIDNNNAANINAIGAAANVWQEDATTFSTLVLADNFAIEDRIEHATDAAGRGFVLWNSGHVYVTTDSGSIQRGVNAATAGDTLHITAGEFAAVVVIDRSLTVEGAQLGQDADTRFGAFTGGKASTTVETVITAGNNNPQGPNPNAEDLVRVLANNITLDGLVIDGNNPALGASLVNINGVAIHARRGVTNLDAANAETPVSGLVVRHTVLQNFGQHAVAVSNGGPVTHGTVRESVIRSFVEHGVSTFTNAYLDVVDNTIDAPAGATAVRWEDFSVGRPANAVTDWRINRITVGANGNGLHQYRSNGTASPLNIESNTVDAAASAVFADVLTWGINVREVQGTSTTTILSNTVGASGGQFARGINLWNLPTTSTVIVSGGSVANSAVGINLDNVDGVAGAGASTAVVVSNVTVAASCEIGLLIRSAMFNAIAAANAVSVNLNNSTVAGINDAIRVETDSTFTADLIMTGGSANGGTGLRVLGTSAEADVNSAGVTGTGDAVHVDAGLLSLTQSTVNAGTIGVNLLNGGSILAFVNNFLVTYGTVGLRIDALAGSVSQVFDNSFTGAGIALQNLTAAQVDARQNWWNSTRGPTEASNPGGNGGAVTSLALVLYTPWWASGTDNSLSAGFQGGDVSGSPSGEALHAIPTQLAWDQQPVSTQFSGVAFSPMPELRAQDAFGNLGYNYQSAVSIVFVTNPTGAGITNGVEFAVDGDADFPTFTVSLGGVFTFQAFAVGPLGSMQSPISGLVIVNNPSPVLTQVAPDWANEGSGSTLVTLSGSGFNSLSQGRVNGSGRATLFVDTSTLMMVLLASDLATPTQHNITVFNGLPGGGTSANLPFTVNGIPSAINLSANTVAENQPANTLIGTLSVTDAFPLLDSHTLALVFGPGSGGNSSFTLVGNQLFTSASFDFETQSSYSIRVRATDSFGAFFETPLTINVTNVNEAPSAAADSYNGTEDVTLNVNIASGVIANDSDVDGTTPQAVLVSGPTPALAVAAFTLNSDGSFSLTPAANFNGTITFDYEASDGSLASAPVTVTITIASVNDVPVSSNDTYGATEDVVLNVNAAAGVLNNDSDLHGGAPGENNTPLTAALVSHTTNGSISLNSDGSFSYTPAANFSGADSFTYRAIDALGGQSAVATVTINVGSANDAPTLINFPYSFNSQAEDDTAQIGDDIDLSGDITDSDGPATGIALIAADNTNGQWQWTLTGTAPWTNLTGLSDTTATLLASGVNTRIRFIPNADFFGTASIQLRGWDQSSGTSGSSGVDVSTNGGTTAFSANVATATITITPVNDAPTLSTIATLSGAGEDTPFSILFNTLLAAANEADIDSANLSFRIEAISSGTLTINGGTVTAGTTIFTLGDVLAWTAATDANGTLAAFTVRAWDGALASASPVQVSVTVAPVNDPPSFTKGSDPSVGEDSGAFTQAGWATAISTGPADESGQSVTFIVTGNTNPGLFSTQPAVSPTGTLTFTPAADANGSATISLVLQDNGGGNNTSATQTFVINITPANDAPTLTAVSTLTGAFEDTQFVIFYAALQAAANEADIDSATVNFRIEAISSGTLTINGGAVTPGTTIVASGDQLEWTPALNANGVLPAFTVRAHDGTLTSAAAVQVSVDITSVNDIPVSSNDTYGATEDVVLNVNAAAGVLNNDSDLHGGAPGENNTPLTAALVSHTTNGSISLNSDGSFSYTPAANFSGADSFTYRAIDALGGQSAVATVTINVGSANDAPTLINFPYSFNSQAEDDTAQIGDDIDLSGDITDSDGPATGIALIAADNTNGQWQWTLTGTAPWTNLTGLSDTTATLLASGVNTRIRFIPNADFFGTASIQLRGWDQSSGTSGSSGVDVSTNGGTTAFSANVATATITITPVNDAPTLSTIATLSGAGEDTPFSILFNTLLAAANEADIDSANLSFRIEAISSGTLTINGGTVTAGTTIFTLGDVLAWTAATDANGTLAAFTVRAWDGALASASPVQVSVTVAPVNDPPSFTKGSDPSVGEDSGAFTQAGWATAISTGPADESGQSVTFIVTGNTNPGLFSTQPAVSPTGTLTFTPAADANGSATISLVLQDNGGGNNTSATQTFVINITPANDAPTLTAVSTLTGAFEDTQFVIFYAALQAAANEADIDSATVNFRIEAISSGTLTINGGAVTPGTTIVASGDQLEWTPALNANGVLPAFTVRAHDGTLTSAAAVQVSVAVTAINDAPTLTTVGTVAGATEDTQFVIPFATLATAANEADVDSATISFRIESISSGTLTINSGAVFPGTTLFTPGAQLEWTPAANANGVLPAFSIRAWDGALASATPVQVSVNVAAVDDAPELVLPTSGTSFVDLGGGVYRLTMNPGTLPANAVLQVVDIDSATANLTVTPPGTLPAGITAPASNPTQAAGSLVAFTGSSSTTDPLLSPYQYTFTLAGAASPWTVQVVVNDVAPQHSVASGFGLGTAGNPYTSNVGLGGSPAVVLANVFELNTAQTISLVGTPTISPTGSPFSASYTGTGSTGAISAQSGRTLNIGDVGNHDMSVTVTDGQTNVTIFVRVTVLNVGNVQPTSGLATGSTFTATGANQFQMDVDPNQTLANADLVLSDADGDPLTVTGITAAPVALGGVVPPPILVTALSPLAISFTGTIDPSFAPQDYVYSLVVTDNITAPVTVTITFSLQDLAPTHVAGPDADATTPGTGTSTDPYKVSVQTGHNTPLVMSIVTDPNTGQTLALTGVNTSAQPLTAFTFSLAGTGNTGDIVMTPNAPLGAADVGVWLIEFFISDGGSNTISVFVELTVTPAPPPPGDDDDDGCSTSSRSGMNLLWLALPALALLWRPRRRKA